MKNLQSRTKVRLLQSFLLISLSLFFLAHPAYAQGGFAVKGVIVDKTGFPLPGANVMEKGTSNGTITDLDGNFSLNVSKKGVTLTVSFMGYTPKDVVVKDKTMNITLEENAKLLDEVVVVGYGTMKRKEMTSAISHVGAKDLNQISSLDASMLLQGKVSSVSVSNTALADPNSTGSIQIRGISSRNAGLGPLIVVDGVPGGDMTNINPADIESIDVLKDGAASAIYGTRGSNGVILVNLKKEPVTGKCIRLTVLPSPSIKQRKSSTL